MDTNSSFAPLIFNKIYKAYQAVKIVCGKTIPEVKMVHFFQVDTATL
jgi:hypothetical protein